MSPFTIYVIALTAAYILYYTAVITLDLNSKPKTEEETEENFDTSDMNGDMNDVPEPPSEQIAEADEGYEDMSPRSFLYHNADEYQYGEQEEQEEQSRLPKDAIPEGQDTEALQDHSEARQTESEDGEEVPEEETESPEGNSESAETGEEEEIPGISTVTFEEDAPLLLKPQEEDKGPAFDPSLNEPPYDVREVIGTPRQESSLARKIEMTQDALESIETRGNQYDPYGVRTILSSAEETEKKNIEVRNEVTRA